MFAVETAQSSINGYPNRLIFPNRVPCHCLLLYSTESRFSICLPKSSEIAAVRSFGGRQGNDITTGTPTRSESIERLTTPKTGRRRWHTPRNIGKNTPPLCGIDPYIWQFDPYGETAMASKNPAVDDTSQIFSGVGKQRR
jgi:hypothetical protein